MNFAVLAIQPICLPIRKEEQERDLIGQKVTVTGWGTTENGMFKKNVCSKI